MSAEEDQADFTKLVRALKAYARDRSVETKEVAIGSGLSVARIKTLVNSYPKALRKHLGVWVVYEAPMRVRGDGPFGHEGVPFKRSRGGATAHYYASTLVFQKKRAVEPNSALVPNNPRNRFAHVIRTYRGSRNRAIIPEALEIGILALGNDQGSAEIADRYHALWQHTWADDPIDLQKEMVQVTDEGLTEPWSPHERLPRYTDKAIEAYVEELYDMMPTEIDSLYPPLPDHHPHEFMISWIAKELGRLYKAYRRDQVTGADYERAVTQLKRQVTAIAMWAEQEKVNLNETTLAEAFEALLTFEVDAGEVPQGDVVYTFDNGYTIQLLSTEASLVSEGEIMQHCVGSYCRQVAQGEVAILSLRDPKGLPHATIEWRPTHGMPEELGYVKVPVGAGTFEQIRGKQNDVPAEKYRPMIQQFLEDRFHAEPIAMLMVAMPGQTIVFDGVFVENVDFTVDYSWGGVDLSRADFSGASLFNCIFGELEGVSFDEATIDGCYFGGPTIRCSFVGSGFEKAEFGGRIGDSDFGGATLAATSVHRLSMTDCSLRGAELQSAVFESVVVVRGDWQDLVLSKHTNLDMVWFEDTDLSGLTVSGTDVKMRVAFKNMDLSDVSPRVLRLMVDGDTEIDGEVTFPSDVDSHSLIGST